MREIKFKAWNKALKVMVAPCDLVFHEYTDVEDHFKDVDFDYLQFTGLKDKNERDIYYNCEIFKFKYMTALHERVDLIGVMNFNDIDLCAEIDIYRHPDYTCLTYQSNGIMHDFEVIGTVQENRELLENNNCCNDSGYDGGEG